MKKLIDSLKAFIMLHRTGEFNASVNSIYLSTN